jgi:UDP-N-acetylglucosamine 2-epimerase (non-hydrolysing)
MSDQFFSGLGIHQPDFDLGVGSVPSATQTAEIMKRLEAVLIDVRPDVVVIIGHENSALAAALTAAKLRIPVAHLDAGLRTFDRTMPEEINRVVTDAVSTDLFVAEQAGRENLRREGLPDERIHFVGNVMIDALLTFGPVWEERADLIGSRIGLESGSPYAVLSLHESSSIDDSVRLAGLLDSLQELVPHLSVVFPVQPTMWPLIARHDLVQEDIYSPRRSQAKRLICLEPLAYLDFVALMSRARVVLTDSGAVQDEATALRIPCLTLRETTERRITVTQGTNRVIGSDPRRITQEVLQLFTTPPPPAALPSLWDGHASRRITEILLSRRLAGAGPSRLSDGDATLEKAS